MNDKAFKAICWFCALTVFFVFFLIVCDVTFRGISGIGLNFSLTAPENSGRAGGIAPILASTFLTLLIALGGTLPLGLACALWLSEFVNRQTLLARMTEVSLDALSGIPSIVFGLFGNAFFSHYLGLGFSLLSGGLTLACMALPLFIKTSLLGLQALGMDWRKQGAALGMSKAALIWHVLLPAATPAIVAGVMLAIGRAIAESVALIFTSGYSDRWPTSVFDSGRTLTVHIYDLAMNVTGGDSSAYASALTLMLLIIIINTLTLWLSELWLRGRKLKA